VISPTFLFTNSAVLISILCAPFASGEDRGQAAGVYACVINNSAYVVGSENPRTGLFQLRWDKKEWYHLGWQNGRPFGIAIERGTNPQVVYLASGNGVQKSTDGGRTWAIKTGWEITEVQKIVIHPTDPRILYIATPYGVWKSTDAGESWKNKNRGLKEVDQTFVTSLVIDRVNPSRIIIGTEDGVLESRNAGDSWRRLGLEGKAVRALIASPHDASVLAAGTEDHGIYLSHDGGKTWRESNHGLDHKTVYALTIHPSDPNTFYAGGFHSGIYKSTDEGKTWKNYSNGLANPDIHAIAVSPTDSKLVFVGTLGGGVFRSDDGGETWEFAGLPSCFVWDLKIQ
jgi:photosystem II stability/assembly factor-like uncharacterized protein